MVAVGAYQGVVRVTAWRAAAFLVALALLGLSGAIPAAGALPQELGEAEQRQANGILEAGLANVAAWRTGDFLLREIETGDTLGKGRENEEEWAESEVRWLRLTFDYDRQWYRFAWRLENRKDRFPVNHQDAAQSVEEHSDLGILVLRDGRKSVRNMLLQKKPSRRPFDNPPEAILAEYRAPDLRTTILSGWESHPQLSIPEVMESLVRSSMQHVKEVRFAGDGTVQLVHYLPAHPAHPIDRKFAATWDCKLFALLGAEAVGYGDEVDGRKQEGKIGSVRMKWRELNGCAVPCRIECNAPSLGELGERRVVVLRATTVDVHWLSLNEPLDDSLFDDGIVDDMTAVARLVDPVAAGADTLIDRQGTAENPSPADR